MKGALAGLALGLLCAWASLAGAKGEWRTSARFPSIPESTRAEAVRLHVSHISNGQQKRSDPRVEALGPVHELVLPKEALLDDAGWKALVSDPLARARHRRACYLVLSRGEAAAYTCFERAGGLWKFTQSDILDQPPPGKAAEQARELRAALTLRPRRHVALLYYEEEASPAFGFRGDRVVSPERFSNVNGKPASETLVARRELLRSRLGAPDSPGCLKVGEAPTPDGPGLISHNPCCRGLEPIEQKQACGQAYGGYAGICAACGDGRCDSAIENACNCAKDCGPKK